MNKVLSYTSSDTAFVVYLDNGEKKSFKTSDPKTNQIIKAVIQAVNADEVVDFDVKQNKINFYKKVEQKTNGVVRFFRMAKRVVTGSEKEPAPYTLEHLETLRLPDVPEGVENEATETLVAMVTEPDKEPVFIEDAQNLEKQVEYAAQDQNTSDNLINFMRRFATVAKNRKHSADDLLAFLKKHDMPLTVNGDIVAYKRLVKQPKSFVDTHSRKVTQWVGSYVHMDPSMVDPDRYQECSNGLHVASRSYLSCFGGNTIIMVLIKPEDVIAVPVDYGRAKMRTAGYQIVAEVSKEGFEYLSNGKSLTVAQAEAQVLTSIINGKHFPQLSEVIIAGPHGSELTVKGKQYHANNPPPAQSATNSLDKVEPTPEQIAATNTPEMIRAAATAVQPTPKPEPAPEPEAKEPTVQPTTTTVQDEMTEDQKMAKAFWHEVKAGTMTKTALAKSCNTSTRSLDRWAVKFDF